MKAVIFCVISILLTVWLTEVYGLVPAFDKKAPKYASFMDGKEREVTYRYYTKEITSIIGWFLCLLSFSILMVNYSVKASIMVFVWAAFKAVCILLYVYNHCEWGLPFYITATFMTGWGIWLIVQRDWMKMKIVR